MPAIPSAPKHLSHENNTEEKTKITEVLAKHTGWLAKLLQRLVSRASGDVGGRGSERANGGWARGPGEGGLFDNRAHGGDHRPAAE